MSQVGDISVKITSDTTSFEQGTRKVQQGTGQMSDNLKRFGTQLRGTANSLAMWGSAAAAAAVTAGAAITRSTLNSIKELRNLANAAGLSVTELERGAYAANQFGISQEKYADILKDVNDRVGDFIATGAGPMADFFENVAPKVGVTVDQFKRLNSQEALGLYIKSLEQANVSQQEMTFYLEAMASDANQLLPLFADNAKELNAMSDAATRLGIGLSEIEVKQAIEAQKAMSDIGTIIDSEIKQTIAQLSPLLTKFSEDLRDSFDGNLIDTSTLIGGIENVAIAIGYVGNAIRGWQMIFARLKANWMEGMADMASVVGFFSPIITTVVNTIIGVIRGGLNQIIKLVEPWSDKVTNIIKGISDGLSNITIDDSQFESFTSNMQKMAADARTESEELNRSILPVDIVKNFFSEFRAEREKAIEEIAESNKSGGLLGMGGPAVSGAVGNVAGEQGGLAPEDATKMNPVEQYKAETVGLLEALGLRYDSMAEAQLAANTREQELLQNQYDNKLIMEEEFADRMAALKRNAAETERQITLSNVQDGFKILAQGSKKVQKLMQGVAIYQALIKGKEAAVSAWAAGMSTGGPFAPLVAAAYTAASLARTGAMISAIKSGGSGSGGGGGGSVPTPQSSQPAGNNQSNQSSGPSRIFNVDFIGDSGMSTKQTRNLLMLINEQAGDNVEINLRG